MWTQEHEPLMFLNFKLAGEQATWVASDQMGLQKRKSAELKLEAYTLATLFVTIWQIVLLDYAGATEGPISGPPFPDYF